MKSKNTFGCIVIGIAVALILVIIITIANAAGSYNKMVTLDESVKEKWSQVENVYQRRFDLIPNLVETVKGYANFEKETLQSIADARSKAGGTFNISEQVLNDPAMFKKFQEAQNTLGGTLQRLMTIVEKYPDLKANQNFMALQSQLEGTENRITVERKRFNETAREYNSYIRKFPQGMFAGMFGFKQRPYFEAQKGAESAPKVEF